MAYRPPHHELANQPTELPPTRLEQAAETVLVLPMFVCAVVMWATFAWIVVAWLAE